MNASKEIVSCKFDLNCLAVIIKEAGKDNCNNKVCIVNLFFEDDPEITCRGGGQNITALFDGDSFASRLAKKLKEKVPNSNQCFRNEDC